MPERSDANLNSKRAEGTVNATTDPDAEFLVDRSRVRDPYLRLLQAAIGQELVRGSPWVAVNRQLVLQYGLDPLPVADGALCEVA